MIESDIRMESQTAVGDFGLLFRLMHSPLDKAQSPLSTLHGGSGHFTSGCEQKLQKWVEHSNRLLSRPPIESICVTSPGDMEQCEIDLELLEELEVISAVQIMKPRSHSVRMIFHSRSPNIVFWLY